MSMLAGAVSKGLMAVEKQVLPAVGTQCARVGYRLYSTKGNKQDANTNQTSSWFQVSEMVAVVGVAGLMVYVYEKYGDRDRPFREDLRNVLEQRKRFIEERSRQAEQEAKERSIEEKWQEMPVAIEIQKDSESLSKLIISDIDFK